MPNLRQLEYLVAIADTLNFRRAAAKTSTTQPTLSEQLKALEQRVGAQLVERSRRHVLITPIGGQIVEIARRMLADAHEIRALGVSGGKELAGVLRLGMPPTIGPYLLPRAIPELQRMYAGLKLHVREELPIGIPTALGEGRYDLAICPLPITATSLVAQPLFREPLYLAVSKHHRLAKRTVAQQTDLEGEDVLALEHGHQLHDAVIALCAEFGAKLRYDYEGTSLDTLREMVAMDLGITFLPGLYVKSIAGRDSGISILKIERRNVYRTVGLLWRRATARQDQYQELAEMLRDLAEAELRDVPTNADHKIPA